MPCNRRQFLYHAACGAGSLALARMAWPSATPLTPLNVAYAGSMAAVMEGPLAQATRTLGLRLEGRAQGSDALARLIVAGSLRPDVFVSITASPMAIVTAAKLASQPLPFATTAMTISYAPRGRWARALEHEPWWKVLQSPGFRFGRSDPRTDPQGRNIIYTCQLAAQYYHQPGLAHALLGDDLNPTQIFSESTLPERVQSGQLDASASYSFQPRAFSLAALTLPAAINLSSLGPEAQRLRLHLDGQTHHPEALIFYAAALVHAPHPDAAQRFLYWLRSAPAQTLLKTAGYGTPSAADVHA